ncbi:MAG: pyrroline-5-carboxylate reductase [Bdellovibrionota bacterium]
MTLVRTRKIGFIGAGNMGQAIINALIDSKTVPASQIFATNRSFGNLKKVEELGVTTFQNNEELVDACDIVVLAVKPQDLVAVLEPIASSFHEGHLVISLAAGFSLQTLKRLLPDVSGLARAIQKAVVGYCMADGAEASRGTVEEFLAPLGLVVQVEEGEEFEALTVSCGSGPGFVFELMQYWQEWLEEHGFEPDIARRMVVQTFVGAATLAEQAPEVSLNELQDRVVSKKGVTAAGLQSMRELEIERALRYSFEKAVIRDQEITRGTSKQ